MKNILTNKWFKFSLVLIIYLLWAYWVGSWWLLILVPVIFDIYITKKVHWAFWKKKGVEKQTKTVEWIDALIFAVAALFLASERWNEPIRFRLPLWRRVCWWVITCLSAK